MVSAGGVQALDITVLRGEGFFSGKNADNEYDLWVTNGTSTGTSELTVSGAYYAGLYPSDLTVFGSELLFAGTDSKGDNNLWVANGTSTSELTIASDPQVLGSVDTSTGPQLTVLGDEVLFKGTDPYNDETLWVTNGTSAGTSELTVSGAYPSGMLNSVDDPDFTVFGTRAVFAGQDTGGHPNLWVTNGTSTGTVELLQGTAPAGLFGGVFNPDFTVLGSKVLFDALDASDDFNLWVTDGTKAGTNQLTIGAYAGGGLLANNLFADFTVLGGKSLFEGRDASGHYGLWVTNGASTGTSELTVAGAYSGGLFSGATPDFTVLGNKEVFAGRDASDRVGLWVTDGTSAGTSELTVVANSGGLFPASTSPDFRVVGSEVLFSGIDATAQYSLWTTDGTSKGTTELNIAGAYTGIGGLSPYDITVFPPPAPLPPPTNDFNGDRKSDILWQNTNGQAAVWLMNGATPTSEALVGGNPGPSWHVIGSGDFNGDGKADILWQNTDGQAAVWLMNGTTPTSEPVVANNPGPSWHAIGTGDFNGDGKADILWQNTDGQAAVWLMNGANPTSEALVGGNPGPAWHVIGTGDFNGDGKSDILWQNTDGQAAIWLMNGATPTTEAVVGNNPGASWHLVGSGDFTGNGISDLLWQNTDGQAAIWLMNGTTPATEALVGGNPGPNWHVVGTGDFNGDGKSDILWQNTDGQAAVWLMNGTTPTSEPLVAQNPGASWHIPFGS
ncbi:MAG: VCBS repeat-containing protein [Stellaceae bacterium]